MLKLPEKFILFDLECTTWDGAFARNWSGSGEHRELVHCGAVLTQNGLFPEMISLEAVVKPKINPTLSDYFTQLTGIKQETADGGIDFPTFLEMFFGWCHDFPLYCFDSRTDGSRLFDRDVLVENCNLLSIWHPFQVQLERFHNINEIFAQHGYAVKQSGAAPEVFGIELPARPHNALNDVRGLLIALRALNERVK